MTVSRINTPISPTPCSVSSVDLQKFEHEKNDLSPSFGIKDDGRTFKFIKWLGDDFNSAMQRFVSGITAIFTQPFFDWNNQNVDEDTRRASTARTMGKIIAGMLTGVTIRQICISSTRKFTQNEAIDQDRFDKEKEKLTGKGKSMDNIKPVKTSFTTHEQCLLPETMKNKATAREIKKYRGAIGTFAAVLIMIGTNFLIDVPLTTKLTNYFVKKFKEFDERKKQSLQGGNQ